jgi:CheY-like chemotaxis protein
VVDHDPAFLHLLAELLQDEGYAAAIPPDVGQPYPFVQQWLPDLLILDVVYHRQSEALAALDQLTQDPSTSGIPVLACSTTQTMLAEVQQRRPENALYVLLKPYDLDELLGTIERILRDYRSRAAR